MDTKYITFIFEILVFVLLPFFAMNAFADKNENHGIHWGAENPICAGAGFGGR